MRRKEKNRRTNENFFEKFGFGLCLSFVYITKYIYTNVYKRIWEKRKERIKSPTPTSIEETVNIHKRAKKYKKTNEGTCIQRVCLWDEMFR